MSALSLLAFMFSKQLEVELLSQGHCILKCLYAYPYYFQKVECNFSHSNNNMINIRLLNIDYLFLGSYGNSHPFNSFCKLLMFTYEWSFIFFKCKFKWNQHLQGVEQSSQFFTSMWQLYQQNTKYLVISLLIRNDILFISVFFYLQMTVGFLVQQLLVHYYILLDIWSRYYFKSH